MKLKLLALLTAIGFASLSASPAQAQIVNLSANPLGLLAGRADIKADFAVGEAWTLGPSLSYSKFTSDGATAQSFGIGVNAGYFFSGQAFTDSWIFNPTIAYARATDDAETVSGYALGVLFNYGWFWPSGFNLQLGFGFQYVGLDFSALGLGSISGVVPALNFSLGVAF